MLKLLSFSCQTSSKLAYKSRQFQGGLAPWPGANPLPWFPLVAKPQDPLIIISLIGSPKIFARASALAIACLHNMLVCLVTPVQQWNNCFCLARIDRPAKLVIYVVHLIQRRNFVLKSGGVQFPVPPLSFLSFPPSPPNVVIKNCISRNNTISQSNYQRYICVANSVML